jgi:hypothetical protein
VVTWLFGLVTSMVTNSTRLAANFFGVHSNTKFRVPATEAFRKTNFTRNFGFLNRNFGFSNQNFGFFKLKLRVFDTKLRVSENRSFMFLNQIVRFAKIFFCPTETSGFDSGIFLDQNFGISNPYEFSEKFSKFRAKMNC